MALGRGRAPSSPDTKAKDSVDTEALQGGKLGSPLPRPHVTSAFIVDTEGGALPRVKCPDEVGV